MSYTAEFSAVLPAGIDRRGALKIARRFAARWGASECHVLDLGVESAHSMAAIVDSRGVSLEVTTYGALPISVPELVRRGDAVETTFTIRRGSHGDAARVDLTRDEHDPSRTPPDSPDPVRGHDLFELRTRALSGHAVELMDALAAMRETSEGSWSEHVVQIDVDDARAFDALYEFPEALEVRWAESELNEWIEGRWPNGRLAQDGALYSITCYEHEGSVEVVARTVLDHIDRAEAAKWLEERSGVPMEYVDP